MTRKNKDREGASESLGLFLGLISIVAVLHGLSIISNGGTNSLLGGPLGIMLIGGSTIVALIKVFYDLNTGRTIASSLLETILLGGLIYLVAIAFFWWINENYIKPEKPIFDLGTLAPSTPTPKP